MQGRHAEHAVLHFKAKEIVIMQDSNLMENAIQPFVQLAQSNLELMKNFPLPEAPSVSSVPNPFLQGPTSTASLLQTNAFLQLMQGAVKNYTEFMVALGQNGMAAVSQTQAGLLREQRGRSGNVVDASEARHKRRVAQEA